MAVDAGDVMVIPPALFVCMCVVESSHVDDHSADRKAA